MIELPEKGKVLRVGRERYAYKIYGLTLCANRPLPGLVAASASAPVDVWVDLAEEQESELPFIPYQNQDDEFGRRVWNEQTAGRNYLRLWFRGSSRNSGKVNFRIDADGNQIWGIWTPMLVEDVITLLLGSVLGCTLRLRGTPSLHASVVAIDRHAILIIGTKGAGKSTTAAALAKRGQPILSDDMAVLSKREEAFLVQPGYPRLRLWPKAINTLYGSEVGLLRVLSPSEKRYVELNYQNDASAWWFQQEPLPLAAIYVLGERQAGLAAPAIEPIAPMTAIITLMAHRSANFLKLERDKQAEEFAQFSHLATTVPMRTVKRPDSLEALPQLCDAILQDLGFDA